MWPQFNTRRRNDFRLPFAKKNYGKQRLFYQCAKEWNILDASFNPFTFNWPNAAKRIHVLSTPRDVISFKGLGQLWLLTCAEWRDLSSHTRMSTIQWRTPEKTAKSHARLTCKSSWKSSSITHLPLLSPNPKIPKAFLKTLLIKMKPTKCPAREKKWARKAKKEGRREREK